MANYITKQHTIVDKPFNNTKYYKGQTIPPYKIPKSTNCPPVLQILVGTSTENISILLFNNNILLYNTSTF